MFNLDFFFLRRSGEKERKDKRVLEKQGNGGKLTKGLFC